LEVSSEFSEQDVREIAHKESAYTIAILIVFNFFIILLCMILTALSFFVKIKKAPD
jgi:small neutral amino acid transporter SnatA (MarC family)